MKSFALFILFILAAFCLNAQTITVDREVIANAGDYSESTDGSLSLSWTLGETITETVQGNTLTLTQGFQQPDELIVSVREIPLAELGLKVFPNPTSMEITIQLENPDVLPLHLQVFNLNGQLLETKSVREASSTISVVHLPNGTYLLRFLTKENQPTAPVKLQKMAN